MKTKLEALVIAALVLFSGAMLRAQADTFAGRASARLAAPGGAAVPAMSASAARAVSPAG